MKKYQLATVTSMGLRITPVDRQPVHTSDLFRLQTTSAESNVLSVSAALGMRTKVLTKFVAESPMAQFIKANLRNRGIEYEGPDVPQGDAWGYRHQFNIADSGYGLRGPRVWNDRAGEVGRTLNEADFDLERIFGEEGVEILHLSGLVCALSHDSSRCCLAVARMAKKYGTKISFDLNYRASFWKGREKELSEIFSEIASIADILIGNEEDFQLALGIQGPEAGGKDIGAKIESFQGMIMCVREHYPNTEFWGSVIHTLIYAFGQIVLQVGGGLLLAVLLSNIVVLRKPLQVMYYLPVIISTVALCQMFKKMFGVVPAGLVNQILSNFNSQWGHIEWLTSVKSSLAMVTAVAGYKNMPVYMLIFYSAFLTIPNSLVEAAKIDGANSFQIFTKIKLTHIRPTIFANVLLVLNGSLRGFDIAKLLTAGGPINSSQLQAMYMYKQAFSSQKYGYGSSVAMFIVFESLILAILIRWMSSSKKLGGR